MVHDMKEPLKCKVCGSRKMILDYDDLTIRCEDCGELVKLWDR